MKFGMLSDYFDGAGAKYLTEVEVNKLRSNQHEFQGVKSFKDFLGEPSEKLRFDATFYWLEDDEGEGSALRLESFCTWSDVRRAHPNRTEYHLYYGAESQPVIDKACAGDLLVVAKTKKLNSLLVILCPAQTTVAQQMLWLFGLDVGAQGIDAREIDSQNSPRLSFAAIQILDDLQIKIDEPEPDALSILIDRFGLAFPETKIFSDFARNTFGEVDPISSPDETLVAWMDHEELLFRHLERHIVADRLKEGFADTNGADVDGFLSFSLSVQNRRKSRAGLAFGHHVETVLAAHGLRYKREATTEKHNGPDFLFPGESEYHDDTFAADSLFMLAAKTSCKDRWRQVLAEADRIRTKHLLTLQPGISEKQTQEMQKENLQLVVPSLIFNSYTYEQREWLWNFQNFVDLIKSHQV